MMVHSILYTRRNLLTHSLAYTEIARLKHSLQHLQRTQDELREHVASESQPDPDLVEAIAENEGVMCVFCTTLDISHI